MTYQEARRKLSDRRRNIRGFNQAFYKTFTRDMIKAKQTATAGGNVSDFWKGSDTHKTWLYNHNGGAYCELLTII